MISDLEPLYWTIYPFNKIGAFNTMFLHNRDSLRNFNLPITIYFQGHLVNNCCRWRRHGGGGQGGRGQLPPPPPMIVVFFFACQLSGRSKFGRKMFEVGGKMCRSPPPPPPPPLSDFCRAGAAVARHFAPPPPPLSKHPGAAPDCCPRARHESVLSYFVTI